MPRDSAIISTADKAALPTRPLLGGKVTLVLLERHSDSRGSLRPLDFEVLPFTPRRIFIVDHVPVGTTRGKHAHQHGRQLLVCLAGRVRIDMRSGSESESIVLDSSERGLMIDAGIWASQTYLVADTVLLVLASEPYAGDGD